VGGKSLTFGALKRLLAVPTTEPQMSSLFANLFTTSTPDTRPAWAQREGEWRVSHLDRLQAGLRALPSVDGDVYAEYDGSTSFWVSYRDNRDPDMWQNRLKTLAHNLRSEGLKAKTVRRRGRVVGVRVSDPSPIASL